ncbi:MAG: leucine-rich repeat-containing protein kinase family protein [Pseudomonadota bacterium]
MHTLTELRAGRLAGIRRLDLSCGLTEFPPEIFTLADSLEVLNLSGNALDQLPDDLPRLHRLRVLFCSDNRFTELPAVLGRCEDLDMVGFKANRIRHVPAAALPPRLRWLILTDNDIDELPDELGRRPRLQKLMLAGNRLAQLPATLAACTQLELLRISANRLPKLPEEIAGLPRLAWLAQAGNPFAAAHEATARAAHPVPDVDWAELTLGERLGEGASGVIHRAQWRSGTQAPRDVAVKLFKAALTSDGLPQSEMAACLAAGTHPNLVGAVGRIVGHPDSAQGLLMPLVDSAFRVLAGPPSLDSCTRDVYAAGTRFSADVALNIATGIAAATAHLHARGILHGDLYAHNILWNDAGDALLGDFGAASFLDPDDRATAEALQRTEVRAFGCLLEELLAHTAPEGVDADHGDRAALRVMSSLQARCGSDDLRSRPLMADVHRELARLA